MEVIATTKFTRRVPYYFQTGNTFMILKYDTKSVRSGLHIANSPTLHKSKKKLENKKNKKNKNRLAELSLPPPTWFPMVTCQTLTIKWLQSGDCFYLIQQTDSFLQVYLQRAVARASDCGDVQLCSALLRLEAAAAAAR